MAVATENLMVINYELRLCIVRIAKIEPLCGTLNYQSYVDL